MTGKTFSRTPNTAANKAQAALSRKAAEKPRTVEQQNQAAIANAENVSEISRVGSVRGVRDVGEGRVEVTKANGKTQVMPQRVGAASVPAPAQYIKANTEANAALQAARSIIEDIQPRGMIEGPRKNLKPQQEQLGGISSIRGQDYRNPQNLPLRSFPKTGPESEYPYFKGVDDEGRSYTAPSFMPRVGPRYVARPDQNGVELFEPGRNATLDPDYAEILQATPNSSLSQQSREYGRPELPLPYTPPDDTPLYNRPGAQMTDRFQQVNTSPEARIFPTTKGDFSTIGEAAKALYFQNAKANPSNKGRFVNPPESFTAPQVESIKQYVGQLGVDPDTFNQFTTKEGVNVAGFRGGPDPRAVELPYKPQRQNPYEGTYRTPSGGTAEFAYTKNLGDGKFAPVYSYRDGQGQQKFSQGGQTLARVPELDRAGYVKGTEAPPNLTRQGFLKDGNRMQARLQLIGQNAKDAIEYNQAQRNKIGYALEPGDYGNRSMVDEMEAVNRFAYPKTPPPTTDFAKAVTGAGPDAVVVYRGRDGKTTRLDPGLNIFQPGRESAQQGIPAVGAFSRSSKAPLGRASATGTLSIAGMTPGQVAGLGIGSPATDADTAVEQGARIARNQIAIDRAAPTIEMVDGKYPDGTFANVLTKQGDAVRGFGGMANLGAGRGKDGFSNEQLLYALNQDPGSNGDLGNGKRGNRVQVETVTDDGDREPLPTAGDREDGPVGAEELSDSYAMGSRELDDYNQVADGAATVQNFLDDIYGGQEGLGDRRAIQGMSVDIGRKGVVTQKDAEEAERLARQGLGVFSNGGMVDSSTPYPQGSYYAPTQGPLLREFGPQLPPGSGESIADYNRRMNEPRQYFNVRGHSGDPNSPKAFTGSVMARSVHNNNSRNEVEARIAGGGLNQNGAPDAPVLKNEGMLLTPQLQGPMQAELGPQLPSGSPQALEDYLGRMAVNRPKYLPMERVTDNRKVADGRLPDENVERTLDPDGYLKTVKRPDEFKEPRLAGSPEYRTQIGKLQDGYPGIAKLFDRDDVEAFSTTNIDINDAYNINSGEYEAQNLTRAEMPGSVSLRLGKGIEDGIYLPGINPGNPAEDFYPFGSTAVAGFGASGVADESGKAAGEKGRNFIENLQGTLGISRTREMFNPLTRETEIVPQMDLTGKTAMEAVGDRERAAKQQQMALRRLTEDEWNNGRTYKDQYGRTMAPNFNVLGPDGRPVHETYLEQDQANGLPERETLYDFVKGVHGKSISGKRDYNMYEGGDPLAHLREYGEARPLNEALRAIPGNLLQQGYATQEQNNIYKKSKQIMDDYTTGTTTFNKTPQQAFAARYRDGTTETVIADLGLGEVMKIQGALRNTDLPRLESNLSGEMGPADPLGDMGQFAEKVRKGQMSKDEYLTQAYLRLNNAAAIASVPGVQTERVARPDAVLPSSRQVGLMSPGVERVRTMAPESTLTEFIDGRRPDPRRQLMTGLKAVDQRFDTAFNAGSPDYGASYSEAQPGEAAMSESARTGKTPRTQEQMAQQRADDADADAAAAARQKNIEENAARRKEYEMLARYQREV